MRNLDRDFIWYGQFVISASKRRERAELSAEANLAGYSQRRTDPIQYVFEQGRDVKSSSYPVADTDAGGISEIRSDI